MPRAIWKGAITFGLVHLPIELIPATQEAGVSFQWLDRKTLDPVGYKRYNKRTGRELQLPDIVKGVRQGRGKFVVLSDEEIRAAFPKSTQTIEISGFVKTGALPLMWLERPYYIEPASKAGKVYALLREAMRGADVAAMARIVMHNKEHRAAIIVVADTLVLELMRWGSELRPARDLHIPGKAAAGVTTPELKMAARLIEEMTGPFTPDREHEQFSQAIAKLVRRKLAAGKTKTVEPLEEAPQAAPASNVIDLAALLRQSVRAGRNAGGARGRRRRHGRRAGTQPREASG
jgi:DNA end-binding protein Ku